MLCKYIYIYILYTVYASAKRQTKPSGAPTGGRAEVLQWGSLYVKLISVSLNLTKVFSNNPVRETKFLTKKLSYKNSVDERPRSTSRVRKLWSLEKSGNHCSKQSWMTPFTTSPCFNVSSEMLSRCPVVPYAVWIKRKRFSPRPKCKSSPRVYVHIRSPGVFPGASASLNSNCQLSNHWMLQRFWLQSLLPSTSTWARGTAYKQKSALSSSHIICILCRLPLTEVRITKSCNVFISTATEGRWICFYST